MMIALCISEIYDKAVDAAGARACSLNLMDVVRTHQHLAVPVADVAGPNLK